MANINDYIKWRGDIPISKEYPINEIDCMIFARISYLLFNRIEMDESETLESIGNKMRNFKESDYLYKGDSLLIENLSTSKRFKNVVLSDFYENNEKSLELQFGAITLHPTDDEIYVSYIGTNSLIYGWKEDFNMAFLDDIPCQLEGKKYLETIATKYSDKLIRVGGHSKGGNVAMYSALTCDPSIENRIIKVYNYDGPGLTEKLATSYKNSKILYRIESYFPQDSIIGRVLYHPEKSTIVKSVENLIFEHDIYSWQVMGTDIEKTELTKTSQIINNTIMNWLKNSSIEDRKIFIDCVFEMIYSTNVDTFPEILNNITKNVTIILKKYTHLSKDEKTTFTNMIKLFLTSYIKEIRSEKN